MSSPKSFTVYRQGVEAPDSERLLNSLHVAAGLQDYKPENPAVEQAAQTQQVVAQDKTEEVAIDNSKQEIKPNLSPEFEAPLGRVSDIPDIFKNDTSTGSEEQAQVKNPANTNESTNTEAVKEKPPVENFYQNNLSRIADTFDLNIDLEGIELDDETYVQGLQSILEKKVTDGVQSVFESISQTDKRADSLLRALSEGADQKTIDALINNFQSAATLTKINTETEEGKIEVLRKVWVDLKGMPKDLFDNDVRQWQANGQIDTRFSHAEQEYQKHYSDQEKNIMKADEQRREEETRVMNARIKTVAEKLNERKDLSRDDKNRIYQACFTPSKNVKNMTLFEEQIFEIQQKNPEALIDLVDFMTNKKAYLNRVTQTAVNEAVKNQFNGPGAKGIVVSQKPDVLNASRAKENTPDNTAQAAATTAKTPAGKPSNNWWAEQLGIQKK